MSGDESSLSQPAWKRRKAGGDCGGDDKPHQVLGFCNFDVQFRSLAGPERNLCRPEDSKCHEKVNAVSRELQLPRTDVKSEAIYARLH